MQTSHLIGLTASLLALALPAAVLAADDDDIFPADPAANTTVYGADGTVTQGKASPSSRAFVAQLVASGAQAGSLSLDTSGYQHASVHREGYTRPTTTLAPLNGRTHGDRARVTVRWTTQADGTRTMERAFARVIATGAVRKVSVDAARRLSKDPRKGKPGLSYVYSSESGLPATSGG